MGLTASQRQAVIRLGQDVCVLAGPGSGKTRVLVERYRWLVESQGLAPARLLAITFTEKAAAELRHRLFAAFLTQPDLREAVAQAPICTIDALCARLLRENALALGVDPDFEVLEEAEAALLLRQAIDAELNQLLAQNPERFQELFDAWVTNSPVSALARVYRDFRMSGDPVVRLPSPPPECAPDASAAAADEETGLRNLNRERAGRRRRQKQSPPDVVPGAAPSQWDEFARPRQTLAAILTGIDQRFQAQKRARCALDFHDLEALTLELLTQSPEAASQIRARYDFILMDEVQDTNPLQWRLAEQLRRPGRFFAVGDANQAIYGFRHARPEGLRKYRDAVLAAGGVIDSLRENFRSRAEILQFAEAVVDGQPGIETPGLIAARVFREAAGPAVECCEIHAGEPRKRHEVEAAWVADRILALMNSGYRVDVRDGERPLRFEDIAILCRTTGRFPQLEAALAARGIPYLMTGGMSFFEQQEVLDGLLWLRAVADPGDELALAGVLRSPIVGLDAAALWSLHSHGSLAAGLNDSPLPALRGCAALLAQHRARAEDDPPDLLLTEVFDWADCWSRWSAAQRANVAKLLRLLRERWEAGPAGPAALLDYMDHLRSATREANAPALYSPDAVQLMTIHAAKGLEFPVVFLPALDLQGQQDPQDLSYSSQGGLGARWRTTRGAQSDDANQNFIDRQKAARKEESTRLLYVAMTRAEQKLIVSFTATERKNHWIQRVCAAVPVATVTEPWESPGPPWVPAAPLPEQLVPLPAPPTGATHTVGVTDVVRFLDCPRRYLLERLIGWLRKPAAAGGSRIPAENGPADCHELEASAVGEAVHAVLAGRTPAVCPPEVEELVQVFRESSLGLRLGSASLIRREDSFVAELGGVIVRGAIDLWFEEGGQTVLVDYKTDQLPACQVPERAAIYAIQLQLYALALRRAGVTSPLEAYLHFLRPGQIVAVDVSEPALASAEKVVEQLAYHQKTLDFPLREGQRCSRCPYYKRACPAPRQRE